MEAGGKVMSLHVKEHWGIFGNNQNLGERLEQPLYQRLEKEPTLLTPDFRLLSSSTVTEYISVVVSYQSDFPGSTVVKSSPSIERDARNTGLIPGSERSPAVGNGNPLQYSCQENSMDRRPWQAIVHGVAELDTISWLNNNKGCSSQYFVKSALGN